MVPVVPSLAAGERVLVTPIQSHLASEALLVRVEDHAQTFSPWLPDLVVRVRIRWVEVEDEEAVTPFEDDHLVCLVLERAELVLRSDECETVVEGLHRLVKRLEELVLEVILSRQVESAPAMLIAPAVELRGEIHPLGVSEFVAHEIQIALATEAQDDKAEHLVQGQSTVDDHVRRAQSAHVGVHRCVHEPESRRLIAHNRLIVRLDVRDARLLPSPILQGVCDVAHIPLIVRNLLEELNPHIWNSHREAVVEAESSLLHRPAKRGHARYVFGDGDRARRQQPVN
mmetsp:Transcript_73579/g.204461  ORF Transcript_73579/g.204461 Transcript_73579/m.204461 type:complete len:285 (+) Transcript_73579:237-1091(+)